MVNRNYHGHKTTVLNRNHHGYKEDGLHIPLVYEKHCYNGIATNISVTLSTALISVTSTSRLRMSRCPSFAAKKSGVQPVD